MARRCGLLSDFVEVWEEVEEDEILQRPALHKRRQDTPGNGLECPEVVEEEEAQEPDALADKWNIALLLLLYTLQGVPLGLSASIPLLLQERGVSYSGQALFSLVSWPFSLKLLWAPVVDSVWARRFGRRKSWLVPAQLITGAMMLCLGSSVDAMLHASPDVRGLAGCFFTLYFLMATQDIAVDGWALTMLQRRNVGYASTCNAIGQTIGYMSSYVVFMALNSPEFSNRFRSEPSDVGLVTLGGFMWFWGIVFLVTTVFVWYFKTERPETGAEGDLGAAGGAWASMRAAYGQMLQMASLRSVRSLTVVLCTAKMGFAATDAVSSLVLLEKGLPKEHLAFLGVAITPISMLLPAVISKFTGGPRPMDVFLVAYLPRLAFGVVAAAVIFFIEPSDHGLSLATYAFIVVFFILHQITASMMFVSQMAFFARVSDPAIGGTYMTLLNTLANFGSQWPNTVCLRLMDSFKTDDGPGPYYELTAVCTAIGVAWLVLCRPVVNGLTALPAEAWRLRAD